MAELEQALDAVLVSDRAHFVGPRESGLVSAAEEALGVPLPPTYRRFVAELGAGSVGGREFYGAIDENFVDSSIPDGIWLTLDERERFGFPNHLVIVGDAGLGGHYVLDTSQRDADGECPVVVWVAGQSQEGDNLEVAPDFGSFFWDALQQVFGPR
ncbi:MAG: SMI1/KNR4 family protein [Acidimicrobiales bacterium]